MIRAVQMFLMNHTPEWLGNVLIRFQWGRLFLGFEEPEPIRWVDAEGGGWRHPPRWLESGYEDVGQHDIWKQEMRIFLLRIARGLSEDPGAIDLYDFGVTATSRPARVPILWPVGIGLADACRRLGFFRLAVSACPELENQGEWLQKVWEEHGKRVEVEAERRRLAIVEIAKKGIPSSTLPERAAEEARVDMDLGPFAPDIGKDFPLLPYHIGVQKNVQDYLRKVR